MYYVYTYFNILNMKRVFILITMLKKEKLACFGVRKGKCEGFYYESGC
jgi:hypothetical protein